MCISAVMLAANAVQAGAAIQQGRAQKAYGEYQAKAAERDANIAEGEARAHADKIRKAGRSAQADAQAAVAASGLSVNSTSSMDINAQIGADFESDALASIYTGQNQGEALRSGGQYAKAQGRTANRSALLSAAAIGAQGWNRAYPQKVGAPIDRSRDIGYRPPAASRASNIYVG